MTEAVVSTGTWCSDGELLREFAQSRREAAFAEIVRRHGGMVLGVCRAVLGNTPDAEDAAQAVFLTLARKAGGQRAGSLAGWLHRVAWYVSTRAAKARKVRLKYEKEAARMRPEMPDANNVDLPLERLHEGLESLPEKYRLALLLHHVEGRSQAETASLLGCGVSALAMRLNRGREMLRKRLGKNSGAAAITAPALLGALGMQATTKAAPVFVAAVSKAAVAAAGGTASASVSAFTVALSHKAMNMLFWTKIKLAATVLLATAFIGGGTGVCVSLARANTVNTPHLASPAASTSSPLVTPARTMPLANSPRSPLAETGANRVTGVIVKVADGTLTLKGKDQSVDVPINDATVIKVNGKVATAADLKPGMNAIAFVVSGSPATEVRAYTPTTKPTTQPANTNKVFGAITVMGTGSITLTYSGKSVTVTYNDATVVKIQGKDNATAADLRIGMHAQALLVRSNLPAKEIDAYIPVAK